MMRQKSRSIYAVVSDTSYAQSVVFQINVWENRKGNQEWKIQGN